MSAWASQWTIDVEDVEVMGRFWSEALGYDLRRGDDGHAMLYPPAGGRDGEPTLWLQATGRPKRGKNRVHPDLRPRDGDAAAEVDRLLALGASRADVGQTGDEQFTVLADPEGNEFCVLHRGP